MASPAQMYIGNRDYNNWDYQHYRNYAAQDNGMPRLVIQGEWIGEIHQGQGKAHYWSIEFTDTESSQQLLGKLRGRPVPAKMFMVDPLVHCDFDLTSDDIETMYQLKFVDPTVRQFPGFFNLEADWKCYWAPLQPENYMDPGRHNCVAPYIDETEREIPVTWKKSNYCIKTCYKFVGGNVHMN